MNNENTNMMIVITIFSAILFALVGFGIIWGIVECVEKRKERDKKLNEIKIMY